MHPLVTHQFAAERRARLLHEAERVRLLRTATHTATDRLRVRALERGDIHAMGDLYNGLSPRSRFLRFMLPIHSVPVGRLEQLADIDHVRHEALGAFDARGLVASAHWFRSRQDPQRAEIAVEVADHYQRRGVGSRLLHLLGHQARKGGIDELTATLLFENAGARALIRAVGWPSVARVDGPELSVTLSIA